MLIIILILYLLIGFFLSLIVRESFVRDGGMFFGTLMLTLVVLGWPLLPLFVPKHTRMSITDIEHEFDPKDPPDYKRFPYGKIER